MSNIVIFIYIFPVPHILIVFFVETLEILFWKSLIAVGFPPYIIMIQVTKETLDKAISICGPGVEFKKIGQTIQ